MRAILTVNGGSSSLKCALFELKDKQLISHYHFKLGDILGEAKFSAYQQDGALIEKYPLNIEGTPLEQRHQQALAGVLDWLGKHHQDIELVAFGHRIVHGGRTFSQPLILEAETLEQLSTFIPLAPLHQPYNLKLVAACQALAPALPQIGCFDTMFHSQQPKLERLYAIPRRFTEEGVQKYGFHGLSYQFIQKQLEEQGTGTLKTIVCHLGAGASMCAISEGRSIASSMGFTAVDGLPMGSRCGNIDPGVLLYLQRHYDMDADALEKMIYKESGWLGVSGISSDMLTLHQSDQPEAEEAIDLFCYRAALEIGRLTAALGGLQQIVFTGGVGENDSDVRARILQRCEWLGVILDEKANQQGELQISDASSTVVVKVIATDEEAMIAQQTVSLL